jgi:beta-glucosidase
VSAAALNAGTARLTVTAEVRNTGTRAGEETAQLYIRLRGTSVTRPIRELKGFAKLRLAPGETQTVTFTLGRDELSFWNLGMKDVVEPADLFVWVAPDSAQGKPAKVTIGE